MNASKKAVFAALALVASGASQAAVDLSVVGTAVAGLPTQAEEMFTIMAPIVIGVSIPFIVLKLIKRGASKV